MPKFSDMNWKARMGIMFVVALAIAAGAYFGLLQGWDAENKELKAKVETLEAENRKLAEFEPKLQDLSQQMLRFKQQMEVQKRIVPDEKEADTFIKMVQDLANNSGIEIRRYTAMPTANREFYVEVPFEIDVDGPYYAVLNFFDRVSKAERIINVSNLQVASITTKSGTKVKNTSYKYAPNESILASCTTTTFFSRDPSSDSPPAAAAAKK